MTTSNGNKTAIVTGAARGIGRAIALHLARDGYEIHLVDCLHDELQETKSLIGDDVRALCTTLDLRDRNATNVWTSRLKAEASSIQALILNAGVGGPDPSDDCEALAHFEHVLDINAGAVMRCARDLAPLLPIDGTGRIVVIASILGRMGVAGFNAYCTSKAATIGLMRAMALDLAKDRITVNAICPGWTETAMAEQGIEAIAAAEGTTPEQQRRALSEALPLGRMARPEEIASLAAWLAGPDAGSITGQAVTMSSGDQ